MDAGRVAEAAADDGAGTAHLNIHYSPQIEIVPRPLLIDAVVRRLGEAAKMIADAAGEEQANLIKREVVVRMEVRCRRRSLLARVLTNEAMTCAEIGTLKLTARLV